MTARKWTPGDVAMVSHRLYDDDSTLATHVRILRSDGKWYGSDGWVANDPDAAREIRPLVVIDPEGDLERLWLALRRALQCRADLRDALRSLVADPKPPEPSGLGAVVEAIHDNHFVRVAKCDEGWMRVEDHHPAPLCTYAVIAAVRVLSEGVTA